MRGYVLADVGKAEWRDDLPDAKLFYNGAVIKPAVVSPCTTDVHMCMTGGWGDILKGKPMGHEICGIVDQVGPGVKDFKPGDRVCVGSHLTEWRSLEAQDGRAGWGPAHSQYWDPDMMGVFAERYSVYDADMTLGRIPDNVSWEQAIMVCDMMTTAWTGIIRLGLEEYSSFGTTVVAYGCGPVGLMAIAGAALRGAARIIAIGHRPKTFELAKKFGATDLVDYHDGDVVEQVLKLTDGQLVDGVIISAPQSSSIADGLRMVKKGGVVGTVSGFFQDEAAVIPASAWASGITDTRIQPNLVMGGRLFIERLLNMISYGRIDPSPMADPILHGFDKIEEGFKLMASRDQNVVKPVIICDDL